MFKTTQEFTFSVGQQDTVYDFTGLLVFESKEMNSIGTLHTEDELLSFGALLKDNLSVPEYWTLELLAQHLFIHTRPVFKNLVAVALNLTGQPQRVSEYREELTVNTEINDILELEAIA